MEVISTTARPIAGLLLECGAVQLRPGKPFVWASGWHSPIYCDNRITLSYPPIRQAITLALVQAVRHHYPDAGAIAGVATAGIPQGVLVAEALGLPFLYVRSAPKGHGKGNQVEGRIVEGQPTVLIEDLISTGGSSISAAQAMQAEGATVAGLLATFTYGFAQAEQAFAHAGIRLVCLSDYEALLAEAHGQGTLAPEQQTLLQAWREDPGAWGK